MCFIDIWGSTSSWGLGFAHFVVHQPATAIRIAGVGDLGWSNASQSGNEYRPASKSVDTERQKDDERCTYLHITSSQSKMLWHMVIFDGVQGKRLQIVDFPPVGPLDPSQPQPLRWNSSQCTNSPCRTDRVKGVVLLQRSPEEKGGNGSCDVMKTGESAGVPHKLGHLGPILVCWSRRAEGFHQIFGHPTAWLDFTAHSKNKFTEETAIGLSRYLCAMLHFSPNDQHRWHSFRGEATNHSKALNLENCQGPRPDLRDRTWMDFP